MKRLDHTQLKRFCDPASLNFDSVPLAGTTKEIIGQGRARSAFLFALGTRRPGYNIYAAGVSGSGKTTFATYYASQAAKQNQIPPDMAYVYNFSEPKKPKLITATAGTLRKLKDDLREALDILVMETPKTFESADFESQRGEITRKIDHQRDEEMKTFSKIAREQGFEMRLIDKGITFAPILEGEVIGVEDFNKLPPELRDQIGEASSKIQETATEILTKLRHFDNETRKQVEKLEYNTFLFLVGGQITRLQEKYQDEQNILDYLSLLKEDILDNIQDFQGGNAGNGDDDDGIAHIIPWAGKKSRDETACKYQINIIADNSEKTAAPVEVAVNPTFADIMGEVEYDSEFGNLTTDYMKVKGGLLHTANGGYLILQAADVLAVPFLWEAIKRALKIRQVVMENPKEHQNTALSAIHPENIPLDIKIIMVGSHHYRNLFLEFDEDFNDLFKVSADFDYEMPATSENTAEICCFIKRFAGEEDILPFTPCAAAAVIEFSSRLAGNQKKLSARFNRIAEVLVEASLWAKTDDATQVTGQYIAKAIKEREYRHGMYEEKLTELIEDGIIMINTKGAKVGEINGLAAMDTGEMVFAKPTKITATTYVGKAGIVNIENEAQLSGEIHDKGVQIVIGYLGQKYAQDFPLSLSCRVCFEQSYATVDGDSASAAELYVILSSLSNLPINQEIAVTGSINQRGEIQAVGAITPKIEGFFDLCQSRGLTGTQGVIIPHQNTSDLTLKDSVIQAVADGKFHIYTITAICEAMKLLMGKAPEDVEELVYNKLKDFNEKAESE
ncbi:MAG: AAA family ATPase [Defluviitaleaceae bacterium]|nr:AAA family ATPase [Defluviitaleaceae bacterium]